MVQALFLHSDFKVPPSVHPGKELTVSCQCHTALGTATSVPSCLSELSTQLRT